MSSRWFGVIAGATAALYALWIGWVPLLPTNLYVPLLDLGKITGYTSTSAALYLALVLALYALYAAGAVTVRTTSLKTVFLAGGLFCIQLLWVYPATAADIFGYVAHGRLLALHGANPFVISPNDYPTDPIVRFLAFPGEPSQYGPIWVLLGDAIAHLAQGNLLADVLGYKLVGALAHLAGAGLVYAIAKNLTADACKARLSAYLFLWNPLLLWEMVANGHNDGLMVLGGLGAAWLLSRGHNLLVLPAIAAGALVKAPLAAIAPIMFVLVWRRNKGAAIEGALLAILLAALVYRPFWQGPETLTALRRTDLFTASLGSVLRLALEPRYGLVFAGEVARSVSMGAFAFVVVGALVLSLRASFASALVLAYATLLAAVLLGTTWFQAWYLVWPIAFAAPLGSARRHLELVLLSLGGMLQYLVFIYLWLIGVFPQYENLAVQAAALAAIIGPCLVGSVAYDLRTRRVSACKQK